MEIDRKCLEALVVDRAALEKRRKSRQRRKYLKKPAFKCNITRVSKGSLKDLKFLKGVPFIKYFGAAVVKLRGGILFFFFFHIFCNLSVCTGTGRTSWNNLFSSVLLSFYTQ